MDAIWPNSSHSRRALSNTTAAIPTYTKDVAPILFKNCTSCHRPGEIGPMSLLTYDDVRPRAKDIRDKIDNPRITTWSDRDPRLRFVSLDDVHVRSARPIDAPRGASLVRAGESTLIADLGLLGRSGTVVSFDLGESSWPLRASRRATLAIR